MNKIKKKRYQKDVKLINDDFTKGIEEIQDKINNRNKKTNDRLDVKIELVSKRLSTEVSNLNLLCNVLF